MAPKGHWYTQAPQEVHFAGSTNAFLSSPMEIAPALQPRSQGRWFFSMAP